MTDPIRWKAGSSDEVVIPLTAGDGSPLGSLSGWTAKAQLMLEPGGTVLHEWDTADGNLRLESSSAVLEAPTEVVSLAWAFRYALLDLRLVDPDGDPSRPYRGGFEVIPAYTR